jgi:hypothetical protein
LKDGAAKRAKMTINSDFLCIKPNNSKKVAFYKCYIGLSSTLGAIVTPERKSFLPVSGIFSI